MKKLFQGAEAVVYLAKDKPAGDKEGRGVVIKERIAKPYRIPEIDDELRKARTRREAKVMEEMPVNAPKLYSADDTAMKIVMEHIDGETIADVLEKKDYKRICREIGRMAAEMHKKGIIHGDLTTSNMILADEKKNKIYFIDFGLSFFSGKIEDKAVDLHLLRQALESRHYIIYEKCFREILSAYRDKAVIRRLGEVEKRGRNKAKI